MTPNLLAELAGVSFEVAVVALIVERVMSRRQRREWDFAYRALAERSSEAFVDVMRLIFSRSSEAAPDANMSRYSSFVHLAEQHLGDLRSHIEGSAAALDSNTHQQYRRVERRLAWCLGTLLVPPTRAGDGADLFLHRSCHPLDQVDLDPPQPARRHRYSGSRSRPSLSTERTRRLGQARLLARPRDP